MNAAPLWQQRALTGTRPSPWKNGGGTTRELLAWPDPDDWTVRMSVAQVDADGPFSRFEGITRWFAVLSGAGVRLHMRETDQHHSLDRSSAPLQFDGALALDCQLQDGPTQDFNLMVRSLRHQRTRMRRVRGALDLQGLRPSLLAVWANTAPASIEGPDPASLRIAPGTLAWTLCATPGPQHALVVRGADALLMEISL